MTAGRARLKRCGGGIWSQTKLTTVMLCLLDFEFDSLMLSMKNDMVNSEGETCVCINGLILFCRVCPSEFHPQSVSVLFCPLKVSSMCLAYQKWKIFPSNNHLDHLHRPGKHFRHLSVQRTHDDSDKMLVRWSLSRWFQSFAWIKNLTLEVHGHGEAVDRSLSVHVRMLSR